MLRLGKTWSWAIELAKQFKCDECERHKGPRLSRTDKVRRTRRLNEELLLDLCEAKLCDGSKLVLLNITDARTNFQVM